MESPGWGPNGSGKNVADAVRWVLGEQSAKQLKRRQYAGCDLCRNRENRKSVKVTLSWRSPLDNSDHQLALDYNEVTVARRVYRSGESEYLINGTAQTERCK